MASMNHSLNMRFPGQSPMPPVQPSKFPPELSRALLLGFALGLFVAASVLVLVLSWPFP